MGRWFGVMMLIGALTACASGAELQRDYVADPLTVEAPSSPNWALSAPREVETASAPTRETPIYATGPEELKAAFQAVAMADERVTPFAPLNQPDTDNQLFAFVQRSAMLGFPDVISVRVLDLGAGDAGQRASLAVFSRSVYGYSDFGVNAARVDRWLSALDAQVPRVAGR